MNRTRASRLREIRASLETLHFGGPALCEAIPALGELADVEALLLYRPRPTSLGWSLDCAHGDGRAGTQILARVDTHLRQVPGRFGLFDPFRPEPEQRNRFLDGRDLLPSWEGSEFCRLVYGPLGMFDRHHQPRTLLCEGPSLLGWFGALHPVRLEPWQARILGAAATTIRRRLSIERRLEWGPLAFAALDAALSRLGAPAFVVDGYGAIQETNDAGRERLASDGPRVREALRDAVRARPSSLRFDTIPLRAEGVTAFLALLASDPQGERTAAGLQAAAVRWGLSRRQRDVLGLIVQGATNAVIAESLGIAERTVEFHVSALFDRAGVWSRAALAAAVFSSA